MNIQETGGTQTTIEKGIAAVKAMLPKANAVSRQMVSVEHLIVGLECGGSDAMSGITANPALGYASDLMVRHGGSVILSETPEIYGAEKLLVQRAISREVGEKLIARVHWWEEYLGRSGVVLNNNPSPGNKAGGLTTILDGGILAGDVVVIRYEGPKGGPGMVEMYRALKFLNGLGLAKSTAVITDGRFSGTNNGCFVGHISPEAAEGGPIAIVEDGDEITIDVIKGELHLHLSDEQIEERLKIWKKPPAKVREGYLRLYARMASSADEGAVIRHRD